MEQLYGMDEELLVKQDVRGGLLASNRAHRLAAYRSPLSVNESQDGRAGIKILPRDFTDATVRRLVSFDDMDTSIYDAYRHSFKGTPDLEGLPKSPCMTSGDGVGRRTREWCIAAVIFVAVCCLAALIAVVVYFVVLQIDHKRAIEENASSEQNYQSDTVEFEGSFLLVNSLDVLRAENKISTNADAIQHVETGLDGSFESSVLKQDYKSAKFQYFSNHLDGLRVHFIILLETSVLLDHMGRAIYDGILTGEFDPLVINLDSIEILKDGYVFKYVHQPHVTESSGVSLEAGGNTELTVTSVDSTYTTQTQPTQPMEELQNTQEPVTTEITMDHCSDMETLMRSAEHCNSILQSLYEAFPSFSGQCSQLSSLESCLSTGPDQCSIHQIHRAVLKIRTWFLVNFRAFDPQLCDTMGISG